MVPPSANPPAKPSSPAAPEPANTVRRGDVRSDVPLAVPAGELWVGDVVAPALEVAGVVSGFVVARELVLRAGGQVWGDVYVQSALLESGATVRGWLMSLDEDGYQRLLGDVAALGRAHAEGLPAHVPGKTGALLSLLATGEEGEEHAGILRKRLLALRQLQAEVARQFQAWQQREEAAAGRLAALEEQLAETTGQSLWHQAARQALEQEVAARQEAAATALAQAEKSAALAEQLRQEWARARDEAKQWQTRATETAGILAATQERVRPLLAELERLQSALAQRQRQEAEAEARLREREQLAAADLAMLHHTAQDLRQRLDRMQQELEKQTLARQQAQAEAQAQRARADRLQQEAAAQTQRLEQELQAARHRIQELTTERPSLGQAGLA